MSTHDYVIANASGSAVRSDINNVLAAIVSNNSSSSEPTTKYAYMLWADTTNNLIKLRNAANNAWITLFTTAGGLDVDAASNFNADVTFTGASASVHWDKSTDDLIFNNNAKAIFGTDSDGVEIYHDGSNSYIHDGGTGGLYIRGSILGWRDAGNSNVSWINANAGAGVELYFAGAGPKIATTASGISVTGDSTVSGKFISNSSSSGDYIRLYASSGSGKWDIYGHGANLRISDNDSAGKVWIDRAVYLPDDNKLEFGDATTPDLQIYHTSGGESKIFANKASGYVCLIQNDGNDSNRWGFQVRCGSNDNSGTNTAISIEDGDGSTQGAITFSGGTVTYGPFTAHHPCIVPDSENPSDESMAYPYGTLLETISIEYSQKNGSNTERGIRYKVQKTQSANSKKILGAYGGSMNGGPDGQTKEHQVLILGDGHILVNNTGGNIEAGDGICSSATAGIGQKATANPSMIIGIAQEAITFTGSETKLVAVQYGLQQFIPWS